MSFIIKEVMKSENDLRITGVVSSEVTPNRTNRYVKFRLVHHYAHGTEPLYLDCIQNLGKQSDQVVPKQGDQIRVRAYLQMRRGMIKAVVKSLSVIDD